MEEGIRHTIDREPLDELTESIRQHGILQPIVVKPRDDEGYKLRIGKRRLTAACMARLEKVPAIVLESPLGDKECLAIMLVENLHREDLDPIDEARAHETLETLFQNVDLSLAEAQARECFHTTGPGRTPRAPACNVNMLVFVFSLLIADCI